MTPPAFETPLKICDQRGRKGDKNALSLFYSVASIGLLTFGCLNKVPDREKGAWILISCCRGKVNERGAGRKAERVLHHGAFMTASPYCPQGRAAPHCLGPDRLLQGGQSHSAPWLFVRPALVNSVSQPHLGVFF